MRNNLWIGSGISGMGGIPMLGTGARGLTYLIREIFRNGGQGFAYDPNDLNTLYQDAAGTIPVTAAGQPVGLMLDKSKGLLLGAELVSNLWVARANTKVEYINNKVRISPIGSGSWGVDCVLSSNAKAGTSYKIEGSLITSVPDRVLYQRFTSGSFQAKARKIAFYEVSTGNSTLTFADVTSIAGEYIDIEVSVKELAGNHTYQTVSASRPILGRTPEGGVRNIIISSADKAHASWTHSGGTKVLNVLDAKGTYKAARFSGASTSPPFILGAKAAKAGAHTLRIQVKTGNSAYTTAVLMLRNNKTVVNYPSGLINLVTGSITGNGWSSKELPNGFWECTFTQSTGISLDDPFNVYFGQPGITTPDFDIIIGEVQLESGTQATAYQETISLIDVTESGKKDVYFLAFDGVDDFLQTNNIDFTVTDKVSLFAGYTHPSGTPGSTVLAELSDAFTKQGAFALLSDTNNESAGMGQIGGYAWRRSEVMVRPSKLVASVKFDFYTDVLGSKITGRLNGVSSFLQTTSDTGGAITKVGNLPLYIGRRGGTTLPLNGHLYSLIGIGRLTTDSETIALEKAIAKNIGVTLNV